MLTVGFQAVRGLHTNCRLVLATGARVLTLGLQAVCGLLINIRFPSFGLLAHVMFPSGG